MANVKLATQVRSMSLEDLDAIFSIDRKIRKTGGAVTYENLTTEHIFTINRHVGRMAKPVSYVDLITSDVSELLELGLVAEVEGHVRGFILGRVSPAGETGREIGTVLILGVHPDYQRKGIAAEMVNRIIEKFRTKGINSVHIGIDQRDKDLLYFCENMGFKVGHLIDYSKAL